MKTNRLAKDAKKIKYKVTLYHETYTDYIVEASDEDEAQDLVMMGKYSFIDDTTVKESELIAVEEVEDEDNGI